MARNFVWLVFTIPTYVARLSLTKIKISCGLIKVANYSITVWLVGGGGTLDDPTDNGCEQSIPAILG